jgi:hypothetical protein
MSSFVQVMPLLEEHYKEVKTRTLLELTLRSDDLPRGIVWRHPVFQAVM